MGNQPTADEVEEADKKKKASWLGWFDWLIPTSFDDIFGLLFWGALIVTGAYFVVSQPWGQKMISDYLQDAPEKKLWLQEFLNDNFGIKYDADVKPEDFKAESLRTYVPGTDEQKKIVLPDDATAQMLIGLMKDATGKWPNSMDALTNPAVIFRLLRDKPDYVLQVIRAYPPGQQTGSPFDMTKMLAALQTIIRSAEFHELLTPDRLPKTMAIFEQVGARIPFKPEAVAAFIQRICIKNGQPTEKFVAFLDAAVSQVTNDGREDKIRSAFITLIASLDAKADAKADAPAIAELMRNAAPDTAISAERKALFTLLSNPANVERTLRLFNALGADKAEQVLGAITIPKQDNELLLLMSKDPAIITHLQVWAGNGLDTSMLLPAHQQLLRAIATMSPDAIQRFARVTAQPLIATTDGKQISLMQAVTVPVMETVNGKQQPKIENGLPVSTIHPDYLVAVMMNGEIRKEIVTRKLLGDVGFLAKEAKDWGFLNDSKRELAAFLGAEGTKPQAGGNPVKVFINLEAMHSFFRTMETNLAKQPQPVIDNAGKVMRGIIALATGDKGAALQAVSNEEIAAFFKNTANRDAVGTLLRTLDVGMYDADAQQKFRTITERWKMTDGSGVGELLSRAEGVKLFKEMGKKSNGMVAKAGYASYALIADSVIRNNMSTLWALADAFGATPPNNPAPPNAVAAAKPMCASQVSIGATCTVPAAPSATPASTAAQAALLPAAGIH